MTEPTGDLVPRGESAVAMRAQLTEQRAAVLRAETDMKKAIDTQRAEIEEARRRFEAEMRAKAAELEAQLAPLRAQMAQLKELVWTVDLYLGRDEQITMLRDGALADVDTPITLRQMVLAMDEESLCMVDEGGIDARHADQFFDWLVSDNAHLDQVLPDRKGVVVLRPSRQSRDYGNVFENAAMDAANEASHWLIRNGERVFLLTTDIAVGERLLPTRSEFVDFFYTRPAFGREERVPMEPGSDAWLKASEESDARRRHYMRIMLVLQGLVDRTTVLAPVSPAGVNFLSVEAQDEGKVRIVNELDNVLTTGRPPFRQWQRELNARLRPGMRIVGNFAGEGFRNVNERYDRDRLSTYRHSRLRPQTTNAPVSGVPHMIEDRAPGGRFVIRYDRTDQVWVERYDANGQWVGSKDPERRASCVIDPDDRFLLPFDLATVEELETYLTARTERHAYLSMVPVLRKAIAAKRAEAAAEAPFRVMLAGVLAAEHNVDVATVEAALPQLVVDWKIGNRWARPLASLDRAEEAAAVAGISKMFAAQLNAAQATPAQDAAAVTAGRAIAGALAVGRRRNGTYVVFAPSESGRTVWLDEYSLTRTAAPVGVKRWTIPSGRTLTALTMLWTAEQWASFPLRASRSEHLTGPERAELVERYLMTDETGPAIALTHRDFRQDDIRGLFTLYCWSRPGIADDAEVIASTSKIDELIVARMLRWKRDAKGRPVPVPVEIGWGRNLELADVAVDTHSHFGRYSTTLVHDTGDARERMAAHHRSWRALHLPGRDPREAGDDRRFESDTRWLVWSDPEQIAAAAATHDAILEATEARRSERSKMWSRARGIVEAVRALYLAQREAAAHARFVEDFGDDDTLWVEHRKTLRLEAPHTEQHLDHALEAALTEGVDLTGMTLAQVAVRWKDAAQWAPRAPKELADIAIPADAARAALADDATEED